MSSYILLVSKTQNVLLLKPSVRLKIHLLIEVLVKCVCSCKVLDQQMRNACVHLLIEVSLTTADSLIQSMIFCFECQQPNLTCKGFSLTLWMGVQGEVKRENKNNKRLEGSKITHQATTNHYTVRVRGKNLL